MNRLAKYLFDCGHVQNIQIGQSTTYTLVRANCLPEVKKDRVYNVFLSLERPLGILLRPNVDAPLAKDRIPVVNMSVLFAML